METKDVQGSRLQRHLGLAWAFALTHWLLLAVIQWEDFLFCLRPAGQGLSDVGLFLSSFPCMQSQNILAAVVVGLLAWALVRGRFLRWGFYVSYILLTAYLVLDQIYYKLFFDHFRVSSSESAVPFNLKLAFSSFGHEMDGAFFFNVAAATALLGWLGWRYVLPNPQRICASAGRGAFRCGRGFGYGLAAAAGLMVLAGWSASHSNAYSNLQYHPLVELAQDRMMNSLSSAAAELSPEREAAEEKLIPPPNDDGGAGQAEDARLPRAQAQIRAASPHPNVVLIVLESVGAPELLTEDSLPSARETPNLSQLAKHGIVFNSFYVVFPGTVRSHVALNLGGRQMTGGSLFNFALYPYKGVTLASEFGQNGYRTAMYSGERLNGEAMDVLSVRFKYQKLYDYNQDTAGQAPEHMLNSWGAKEEYTLEKVESWIDQQQRDNRDKPFLVTYMNAATHHPYSIPPGFPRVCGGADDRSRYQNALAYSDFSIGQLVGFLKSRGLYDNTIIAVTGDHGEAFGDLHPHNFVHRERIFEENVRSFLMVSHPSIAAPVVSPRLATSGDLFPTLCAASGLPQPDAPGRNLLAEHMPARFIFFHKGTYPEQWGLRDGRWKFIATIRDHAYELYDLSTDPTEQCNLAAAQPMRARGYNAACRKWFIDSENDFASLLEGYHPSGDRDLHPDDYEKAGPKVMAVGYLTDQPRLRFFEQKTVQPMYPPVLWTKWVAMTKSRMVVFQWCSPSGKRYGAPFEIRAEAWTTASTYPGPAPMEKGVWRVVIADKDGERPLLSTQFIVSDTAEPPKIQVAGP